MVQLYCTRWTTSGHYKGRRQGLNCVQKLILCTAYEPEVWSNKTQPCPAVHKSYNSHSVYSHNVSSTMYTYVEITQVIWNLKIQLFPKSHFHMWLGVHGGTVCHLCVMGVGFGVGWGGFYGGLVPKCHSTGGHIRLGMTWVMWGLSP